MNDLAQGGEVEGVALAEHAREPRMRGGAVQQQLGGVGQHLLRVPPELLGILDT